MPLNGFCLNYGISSFCWGVAFRTSDKLWYYGFSKVPYLWKKGALCNLSRDLGGEDSVPCPFTGMNRYCSLHTEKSFLEHGIEHQLSGTLEKDIMTSTVLLFTFSSYLGKTTYNSIGLPSIPPRPIFRRAKPLYVNRFRSSKQENKSKESKVVFFEVMDREWYMWRWCRLCYRIYKYMSPVLWLSIWKREKNRRWGQILLEMDALFYSRKY